MNLIVIDFDIDGCKHCGLICSGDPLKMFVDNVVRGLPLRRPTGGLEVDVLALAEILPKETLLWKLRLLESASSYANARLHAVKAQVLILSRSSLSPNLLEI
ncbi:Phytyl ester synthase 1, chloroplastic [Linum perenne]